MDAVKRYILSLVMADTPTDSLATNPALATRKTCPKCGTLKKTTRLSCCARGGAWFERCGDTSDIKFDHTWVEGIQACKGVAPVQSLVLLEKQVHVRSKGMMMRSINVTKMGNDAEKSTNESEVNVRLVTKENSEDRVEFEILGLVTLVTCGLILINVPSHM